MCLCQDRLSCSGTPCTVTAVPKLWDETIDEHRRAVREATLYKYFSDVDEILTAWHERQVTDHLAQLSEVRDRAGDPAERLEAVLNAYAAMAHQQQSTELVALLHQ